jgi:two-component system KDP operon response regulator KdpE
MTLLAYPLAAAARGGARKAGTDSKSHRPTSPAAPHHRILVASSVPQEREGWAVILSLADYGVLSVRDGELALQAVQSGRIDVVVAAVAMSKLDGLELLREIGALSRPPAVILIAKGHGEIDEVYLKLGRHYGAAATFTQPLDAEKFLSAVRALAGRAATDE